MRNPFRPNKFELHSRPLIWVAPSARRIMQETGSFYVAGARGSGKTSILKALDSIERVENESLREQIKPYRYSTVGVYMRAQDLFTQTYKGVSWQFLAADGDEKVLEYYFLSSIIEAEAVATLARTAAIWRPLGMAKYRVSDATEICENFVRKFPAFFPDLDSTQGDPIANFADAANRYRKALGVAFLRRDGERLKRLIVEEPLELLREACRLLLPLFERKEDGQNVHLKVAIDECDYLSSNQQIALNTLVRKTSAPIDFVLAYVDSGYDPTTTLFENLALSEADRQVILLANEKDEFAELCEAIVSYRVYFSTPGDIRKLKQSEAHKCFNLQEKLGDFSINELIYYSVSESKAVKIQRLLADAKILGEKFENFASRKLISSKSMRELEFRGNAPPIYQQFLIERLGFHPEQHLLSADRKEVFLSTLRRKQRGALLQILSEAEKQTLPYYGRRIILALADLCVRDFLDIMAEIFDFSGGIEDDGAIIRFSAPDRKLKEEWQRKGVDQASDKKFEGIKRPPSLEPGGKVEVPDAEGQALTRLIDGLGRLTHRLQTSSDGLRSLKTTERGIFVLDLAQIRRLESSRSKSIAIFESVLRRGIRDNHLITDEARLTKPHSDKAVDSTVIRFRLHRRFSPRYRFSYLGAQEDVDLPADAAIELVADSHDFSAEGWARNVFKRLAGPDDSRPDQGDLFLGKSSNE